MNINVGGPSHAVIPYADLDMQIVYASLVFCINMSSTGLVMKCLRSYLSVGRLCWWA